jgi:site-specific recombinase XerD
LAECFLKLRLGDDIAKLSKITQNDIAEFLQHLHSGPRPYRVKTTSTHLRKFLQYLFKAGKTKINLSLGVPSVAQRYGSRLRRHFTPEQVEAILAAVRSDTSKGRRDYAMLLLMARLGLRAPEVVAMQIDDIDWRAGEIIVRGKGQRHDRVPLPQDVGKAMADYIRLDRVTTSRAMFVSEYGPHGPFKNGQIVNAILKDALAQTGLKPPAPYVGSHVLRHSLATNLVQRGASLDEIGNMLRHRSRASTMIYAKFDIEGLRSIAQPWPVTGGAK